LDNRPRVGVRRPCPYRTLGGHATTAMNEEETFLHAIQESPEDGSLRLVYADWLEEHGDARRAEYLRLECQFSSVPTRLKELSQQVDPGWLSSVRRRPVRAVLRVLRGTTPGIEYPLCEGQNYLGRADAEPVDVDLSVQEPPDRIWCSRQHARITCEGGELILEDLDTATGTYLNRARVYPGQRRTMSANDIVQIGAVQMQVHL
jgi:uncharacterized protein (TIGR02996 family)